MPRCGPAGDVLGAEPDVRAEDPEDAGLRRLLLGVVAAVDDGDDGAVLDEGVSGGEAGDATKLSKSDLTADAKGRFINGKGKTVGRSKAFPQVEGEKKVEQEENDDAPLSILIGLPCTKAGKLIDLNGKIVGVLFEGDAESIAESGITASPGGQFWGDKGVLLGRARTVG